MPKRQAKIIPAEEAQRFVYEDGREIEAGAIRFGMKDARGKLHFFRVYRLDPIPEYVSEEIYPAEAFSRVDRDRTCYCFRSFGYRKPDEILLMELIEKMETALLNPVIKERESGAPEDGDYRKDHYLRERGYAEIESRNGEVGFRVDGRFFPAQEFANMFSTYEGFRICWQVRDALTEIPERDTYWLPVRMTDELLMGELEEVILSAAGNREFISYRNMNAFALGFDGLMEKLKLYFECNTPGLGKLAGLKLIHRLEELETDDDQFPLYQVETIRELIGEF